MADKDDADAANNARVSRSPKPAASSSGHYFAAVNRTESLVSTPTPSTSAKSPSPSSLRPNAVPAKTSSSNPQSMTATSDLSSQGSPTQNGAAQDVNGAFPYGTRSRNRNGNSRPNYAEDMDVDLDSSAKKRGQTTTQQAPNASGELSSGSNTRRSSAAAAPTPSASTKATSASVTKDELSGMSTFSVNPDASAIPRQPPVSRKRKAPGASPANGITGHSTHNSGPGRRAASAAGGNHARASNILSFDKSGGLLKNGKLKADDGTVISIDDQVYLICEPPGEPYYLARVMEFLHANNDRSQPVDSLRVNWFFRPRDIQRKVNDTRVVFASMQSDTCPITSLRGKCHVQHRSEIENLDNFRKAKDSFWFEKMFDRYIHRYYEVIPTQSVINVPSRVKKVLDERWKYVIVEIGRGKDLTSAIKSCKRCSGYCASSDSVDCAVCKNTYHMNCVRPPLLKKPARGFGWSCGPCSRKQERRLEARHTTNGDKSMDGEEEEIVEEEEEDRSGPTDDMEIDQDDSPNSRPHPPTADQLAQSRLWPYRYLGIHCRVEDALDYDDRIYPRASSRLGPKHQANVQAWFGHPVEMVKTSEIRKKYMRGGFNKKDAKAGKDLQAVTDAEKTNKEKRPKWVMDAPQGYIERGEDHPVGSSATTAHLHFRMPEPNDLAGSRGMDDSEAFFTVEEREAIVHDYMEQAKALAGPKFNLREFSTNFLDKALELLVLNKYNVDKALKSLEKQKRRQDLKEPELTEDEIRKFEDGVARYGSELRNVSRHVGKSQKHGEIVRFYYMWKKTERGRRIWDNFEGRKGKKQVRQADARLADDVADDDDDSAFDSIKAEQRKRGFVCKFCNGQRSSQWRRAPATAPGTTVPAETPLKGSKDKSGHLVVALCHRCAGLWRRYGIQWENIDEVAKKVAQGGGRALKRRIDEELLIELVKANQEDKIGLSSATVAAAATVGLDVPPSQSQNQDGPKKKARTSNIEPNFQDGYQPDLSQAISKVQTPERAPEPPLVPDKPVLKQYPCEVCNSGLRDDPSLIVCNHCRLTVHPNCYGIANDRRTNWLCDTCENDHRPECSTIYECLLCTRYSNEDETSHEPPKSSHKKRTDREKEKDRVEKELITAANELYTRQKMEKGHPIAPRQALKQTVGHNWSHVICSMLHPAIVFGDAWKLKPAEGFTEAQHVSDSTQDPRCKLCKKAKGAVVNCNQCETTVHASCAQIHGYTIGISLAPKPKSSALQSVIIGEITGVPEVKLLCREHGDKGVFPLFTPANLDGEEMSAIKAFAITRKSATSSPLSGTARRADTIQTAARQAAALQNADLNTNKAKASGTEGPAASTRGTRAGSTTLHSVPEQAANGIPLGNLTNGTDNATSRSCLKCHTDVSPKWHLVDIEPTRENPSQTVDGVQASQSQSANGSYDGYRDEGKSKEEAQALQKPAEVASATAFLCHKCFIRKSKAPPTPPRAPTPAAEMQIDQNPVPQPLPEAEARPVTAGERPPSPIHPSSHWQPAPPAPAASSQPPPERYRRWQAPPEPSRSPYLGPDRVPNGVPHPSPAPPPNPLYMPPTHNQAPSHSHHAHLPSYPAPLFRYDGISYRPNQPPPSHYQTNGFPTDGGSYKWQKDPTTGASVRVPWPPTGRGPPPPPPPPPVSHHPSPAPIQSPSLPRDQISSPPSHIRSPSFHEPGPHGPPEADSNPFAIPTPRYSHASPPPSLYSGGHPMYGSPHVRSRPQTPVLPMDREPKRGSEPSTVQTAASASPSVKNLLH